MAAKVAKQGSAEWNRLRAASINCSDSAAWELKHPYTKPNDIIRAQVRALDGANSEFVSNPAIRHGIETEGEALEFLAQHKGYEIVKAGSIAHDEYQFLRGSPDGLVGLIGGVEAKCPMSRVYSVYDDDKVMYLYQCYGVMEVCDLDWIDFICYISPDEFHIDRVERQEGWLEQKVSAEYMPQPRAGTIRRIDLWQAWHNQLHNEYQDPELKRKHIQPKQPDAAMIKEDSDLAELSKAWARVSKIKERISDDLEAIKTLEEVISKNKKKVADRHGGSVTDGAVLVEVIKKTPPVDYEKIFEHFGGEKALIESGKTFMDFRKTTNTRQISIKKYANK